MTPVKESFSPKGVTTPRLRTTVLDRQTGVRSLKATRVLLTLTNQSTGTFRSCLLVDGRVQTDEHSRHSGVSSCNFRVTSSEALPLLLCLPSLGCISGGNNPCQTELTGPVGIPGIQVVCEQGRQCSRSVLHCSTSVTKTSVSSKMGQCLLVGRLGIGPSALRGRDPGMLFL